MEICQRYNYNPLWKKLNIFGSGASVIKLITAVMNSHMTVKYVSDLWDIEMTVTTEKWLYLQINDLISNWSAMYIGLSVGFSPGLYLENVDFWPLIFLCNYGHSP